MFHSKTWREILRGNPVSADHKPDALEMQVGEEEQDEAILTLETLATTGVKRRQIVDVATTGNITLSGEQTIDGVLTSGSRALVWQQSDPSQNGVYVTGSGAWTRIVGMDEASEFLWSAFEVRYGSTQKGFVYAVRDPVTTVGTDPVNFHMIGDNSMSAAAISASLAGAATKNPPVDPDYMGFGDSEAGGALKKFTFGQMAAWVWSKLGSLIAGGTGKTTPVDGDSLPISDSAASGASKRLTFANLKAWAKTYFDTQYQPLDADLTAIGGLTSAANKLPYFTGSGTAALADFTTAGRALIDDPSAASQRNTLGLGTAATTAATDYATAAQGALADTAVQPGDIGTAAAQDVGDFASAAQGALADTAVQPGDDIDDLAETSTAKIMTGAERTKLAGIEAGADVTDTANVAAAGALMDSEVASLSGVKTLVVPDDTTITAAAKSVLDDTTVGAMRDTLGLADVAATGAYSDLSGKPTLGTAAAEDATDFATAAQGVKADAADVSLAKWATLQRSRAEQSQAFASGLTGGNRLAIAVGSAAVSDELGGVWRLDGADAVGGSQKIAPRQEFAVEAGRVYRARFLFKRYVDPVDPSGHAIEVRIQNLNKNRASVSNAVITDLGSVVAADGVIAYEFTYAMESGQDYTCPSTTRYVVPHLQVYGGDHQTDVAVIQVTDVTDIITATAEVAGDLSDLTTVVDNLTTVVSNKVSTSRSVVGGGLATGGGPLTQDRTITVQKALDADVQTGTDDTKAVTPLALAPSLALKASVTQLDAAVDAEADARTAADELMQLRLPVSFYVSNPDLPEVVYLDADGYVSLPMAETRMFVSNPSIGAEEFVDADGAVAREGAPHWRFDEGTNNTSDPTLVVPADTRKMYGCIFRGQSLGQGKVDTLYSSAAEHPGVALMLDSGVMPLSVAPSGLADLVAGTVAGSDYEAPAVSAVNYVVGALEAKFGWSPPMVAMVANFGGQAYGNWMRGSSRWQETERLFNDFGRIALEQGYNPEILHLCLCAGEEDVTWGGTVDQIMGQILRTLQDHQDLAYETFGQTRKIICVLYSNNRAYYSGDIRLNTWQAAALQLAQTHPDRFVVCGATYAVEFNADEMDPNFNHPTVTGYRRLGTMFGRAMLASGFGSGWAPFRPTSARWLSATSIRIACATPAGANLAFDTSEDVIVVGTDDTDPNWIGTPAVANEATSRMGGFYLTDAAGQIGVTNVTVSGRNIDLTLDRAGVVGGTVVGYAVRGTYAGYGGPPESMARGLIRGDVAYTIADAADDYDRLLPFVLTI